MTGSLFFAFHVAQARPTPIAIPIPNFSAFERERGARVDATLAAHVEGPASPCTCTAPSLTCDRQDATLTVRWSNLDTPWPGSGDALGTCTAGAETWTVIARLSDTVAYQHMSEHVVRTHVDAGKTLEFDVPRVQVPHTLRSADSDRDPSVTCTGQGPTVHVTVAQGPDARRATVPCATWPGGQLLIQVRPPRPARLN